MEGVSLTVRAAPRRVGPRGQKACLSSAYLPLLEDEMVRRWYEGMERGSELTADRNFHNVGRWCKWHGLKPRNLITMDKGTLQGMFEDFRDQMKNRNPRTGRPMAPTALNNYRKALISFLEFHRVEHWLDGVKVGRLRDRPTLWDMVTLDQATLRRILLAADTRQRAIIGLMAFAGLHPQVLGNWRGTNGLCFRDMTEAQFEEGDLVFNRIPTMIVVKPPDYKNREPHSTFLGREGCEYLAVYARERIMLGETLGSESAVVAPIAVSKGRKFVSSDCIGRIVGKAMRAVGIRNRPYALRDSPTLDLLPPPAVDLRPLKEYVRTAYMTGHPVRVVVEEEPDKLSPEEAAWAFRRIALLAFRFPDYRWPPPCDVCGGYSDSVGEALVPLSPRAP